jgi:hypothetical protein
LPSPPARVLMEDFKAYTETLETLRAYRAAHPDVTFIPSHCEASIAAYQNDGR